MKYIRKAESLYPKEKVGNILGRTLKSNEVWILLYVGRWVFMDVCAPHHGVIFFLTVDEYRDLYSDL